MSNALHNIHILGVNDKSQNDEHVPDGFYIQYGSIADQTAAEKASRISPPIYVALLSSGAIEHVLIDVYVER